MLRKINILNSNEVVSDFAILAGFLSNNCDIKVEKELLTTVKKILKEFGFVQQRKAVAINSERFQNIESLLEELNKLYDINIYPAEIVFKSIDGRRIRICESTIINAFKEAKQNEIESDIKKAILEKRKHQKTGIKAVLNMEKLSAIKHYFF